MFHLTRLRHLTNTPYTILEADDYVQIYIYLYVVVYLIIRKFIDHTYNLRFYCLCEPLKS